MISRVLNFKQNSRRSAHHSRRPNTSIVAIGYRWREEFHFTAGDIAGRLLKLWTLDKYFFTQTLIQTTNVLNSIYNWRHILLKLGYLFIIKKIWQLFHVHLTYKKCIVSSWIFSQMVVVNLNLLNIQLLICLKIREELILAFLCTVKHDVILQKICGLDVATQIRHIMKNNLHISSPFTNRQQKIGRCLNIWL